MAGVRVRFIVQYEAGQPVGLSMGEGVENLYCIPFEEEGVRKGGWCCVSYVVNNTAIMELYTSQEVYALLLLDDRFEFLEEF